MTKSTRTAIVVSIAYLFIAYRLLESHEGGFSWQNVRETGFSFLPILILWGWWFYRKRRDNQRR